MPQTDIESVLNSHKEKFCGDTGVLSGRAMYAQSQSDRQKESSLASTYLALVREELEIYESATIPWKKRHILDDEDVEIEKTKYKSRDQKYDFLKQRWMFREAVEMVETGNTPLTLAEKAARREERERERVKVEEEKQQQDPSLEGEKDQSMGKADLQTQEEQEREKTLEERARLVFDENTD